MRTAIVCVLLASLIASAVWAAVPVVSNVSATQRTDGSGKVDITYDLADPDSPILLVCVSISVDGGLTFVTRNYVSGDVGRVCPGSGRLVVWDSTAHFGTSISLPNCAAQVTADDSPILGEMTYIPAGTSFMGNSGVGDDVTYGASDEFPQRSVYLPGYWLGKHEVTRAEYRKFVNSGGYSNPTYWSTQGWAWRIGSNRVLPFWWESHILWGDPPGYFIQTDSHPVAGATYYEAEAFCKWAGGYLPTEAQWEKAARWSGHPNIYPWGDTWDQEKCNSLSDSLYPGAQSAPVGCYSSGAGPYGNLDMAGNTWEWVRDWYASYPGSSTPFDYTGTRRVLRGGSMDNPQGSCRCANRYCFEPDIYWGYGFRLARDPLVIGSILINSGAAFTTSTGVTLTLSAESDQGTAVSEMRVSNDGVFDTEAWDAFVTSKQWTLDTGDGPKTVYVRFRNSAGNESNTATAAVTLDTSPPAVGSVTVHPALAAAGDQLHVVVDVTDAAGVSSVVANETTTLARTSPTTWEGDLTAVSPSGTHDVTVSATDTLGHPAGAAGHYRTGPVVGLPGGCLTDPILTTASSRWLFRVCGRVTAVDGDGFYLSDGSSQYSLRVLSPGCGAAVGDHLLARGIFGAAYLTLSCRPEHLVRFP